MPAFQSTADFPIELEVTLAGAYVEPDPSVGITGITVEDIEIEDVIYSSRKVIPATAETPAHWGPMRTRSLLTDVNIKSPDVQKLLSNLLDIIGDEAASEALIVANAE